MSLRLLAANARPPLRHLSRSLSTSPQSSSSGSVRRTLYAATFAASAGLFAVYYLDARSALHEHIVNPILRNALDAETAHKLALKVLRSGFAPKDPLADDDRLAVHLWGQKLSNPVGLAAGFDKDGEAIDGLYGLGFGWVEIGSVTPKPQPGNPRPRVFRLPEDNAVINRYGFPSQGHALMLARLKDRIKGVYTETQNASLRPNSILAVNLGKNKASPMESIDDYVKGVHTFGPYSDVLVINVSSPNTPGLRGLQNKDQLKVLLTGVTEARDALPISPGTARRPKLVLKIAPDLDELQIADIADVIRSSDIDGVIVSNTTIQRPKDLRSPNKVETGGLSGAPLKPIALQALKSLRSLLPPSIPIIGSGGIRSGADALDYARAGASMVQVYTAFGYEGVGKCRQIKDELAEELARQGTTWQEVVQQAVDKHSFKGPSKLAADPKSVEGAVSQLIAEAHQIQVLLDQLGGKIDKDT